jgi:SMC interacting uncharacterized protein involved in chromosome segregation
MLKNVQTSTFMHEVVWLIDTLFAKQGASDKSGGTCDELQARIDDLEVQLVALKAERDELSREVDRDDDLEMQLIALKAERDELSKEVVCLRQQVGCASS